MTKKRIATLATCLTLVGAVAVGGTLALLTSQVENLQNTFAVGNGYDITEGNPDFILRESAVTQDKTGGYVDNDGEEVTEDEKNEYNNLVSNTTLWKDPTFTLRDANPGDGKTPPDSWVVAKLDQADIAAMAEENITFDTTSASTNWRLVTATNNEGTWTYQMASSDLTALNLNGLSADDENTKYYFIYNGKLSLTGATSTSPLFTKLAVGAVDAQTAATNLDVFGVAVQAVEGSNLTDNLNQIMADAAPLLDKAVADSRLEEAGE